MRSRRKACGIDLSIIADNVAPANRMKASAQIHTSAKFSRRFLSIAGAVLLGTSVIALPAPSAEASFSIFSAAQGKQAGKQARGTVPGRRHGGARRGSCPATQTPLVAIVSEAEVETETLPETYVGGTTIAEYPTVWFDVPYPLTNALTAEFVLQDDQGQDVYRATSAEFAATGQTPGIVGVSLAPELAALEIGKTYQWYFKIDCGSETPPYVQGGIERVTLDPSLTDQLETVTPLEQAALYQQNELWYDAVTILAPLYRAQPNDPSIQAAWMDLMRSLNLD
jgi:Domain of Unknown Function (DUF928)